MNLRKYAEDCLQKSLTLSKYNEELPFSDVAERVLNESPLITTSNFLDFLVKEAKEGRNIERHNPRFGQPSVILAKSENHFVEMLLWRDDITSIHEHSFSGAFKALDGRRMHTTFEFFPDLENDRNRKIMIGNLKLKHTECLHPGDVRKITPKSSYIHMLWTLDRPGLTIVIRENGKKSSASYAPPFVSFDEFAGESELKPYILPLQTLHDNNKKKWLDFICFLVGKLSLNGIVYFLLLTGINPIDSSCWQSIKNILLFRFPSEHIAIIEMVRVDRTLRAISNLRKAATSAYELSVIFGLYTAALHNPIDIDESIKKTIFYKNAI